MHVTSYLGTFVISNLCVTCSVKTNLCMLTSTKFVWTVFDKSHLMYDEEQMEQNIAF